MAEEIDIFDPLYRFQEPEKPKYPPPYIDRNGREPNLIIPHNSDPKYHYWADGQSLYKTLVELGAEEKLLYAYLGDDKRTWQGK
jgi:hypothetical protein